MSDWARRQATKWQDEHGGVCGERCYEELATMFDEARRDGAEQERWECHRIIKAGDPSLEGFAAEIADRGPMRDPKDGDRG